MTKYPSTKYPGFRDPVTGGPKWFAAREVMDLYPVPREVLGPDTGKPLRFRYRFFSPYRGPGNKGGIKTKVYDITRIERHSAGLFGERLFDRDHFEIISRDRSSGFLDKNGVEIFEHDRCQVTGGRSGSQVVQMADLDNHHFWSEVEANLGQRAVYEVIGNIYPPDTILLDY